MGKSWNYAILIGRIQWNAAFFLVFSIFIDEIGFLIVFGLFFFYQSIKKRWNNFFRCFSVEFIYTTILCLLFSRNSLKLQFFLQKSFCFENVFSVKSLSPPQLLWVFINLMSFQIKTVKSVFMKTEYKLLLSVN